MDTGMVEVTLEEMLEEMMVVVAGETEDEVEMKKSLMVWTLAIQIDSSPMKNLAKLPGCTMSEIKQSNDRKIAIDKGTSETHNKKGKMSAVGLTTENQYVVAATIMGFMNKH